MIAVVDGNEAAPEQRTDGIQQDAPVDEDEIFKTLNHKARRDIIKFIGKERAATFSSIKKALGDIESPALAYHLKSLSPLLVQKEGSYALSGMPCIAAMNSTFSRALSAS